MKKIAPILFLVLLSFSCADFRTKSEKREELNQLRAEIDRLNNLITANPNDMKGQIATFLTFQENNAEEAMNFYVGLFENSSITDVQRYGKEGPAKEGSIMVARFSLNGKDIMCSDSYIKHEWDFTPAVSLFVECKTNMELETLFEKLSENGQVMMPLANYGFSQKFGFVEDRFGVSWQLNLP